MKHTVTVKYKSGHTARFRCKSFTVQRGRAIETAWDTGRFARRRPLLLNIDEIESIWQGRV